MPDRPTVPVPPGAMPLWRDGRPLKRWRWLGCFGEEVLLCAAIAHIGPVPVSWWAVWDRERRTLLERTVTGKTIATLGPGRVTVAEGPVAIDLRFGESAGVETISPHGRSYIWTEKQLVRCTGQVRSLDREFTIDAPGIIDDSAGYHARDTRWFWSAGAGQTDDGRAVAWNLVDGLHDAPHGSERTVWVDGEPHEVAPQPFRADLAGVGGLEFTEEAVRTHQENRLIVATDYEQPFGGFRGTLPGVDSAVTGLGVMERHAARW
jgi:hypothetical protein